MLPVQSSDFSVTKTIQIAAIINVKKSIVRLVGTESYLQMPLVHI